MLGCPINHAFPQWLSELVATASDSLHIALVLEGGYPFSNCAMLCCYRSTRGHAMRNVFWKIAVVILLLTSAPSARADDLRAAMEAANARWLAAFNTPNPTAFPALYTADAVVLFQGAPPVRPLLQEGWSR